MSINCVLNPGETTCQCPCDPSSSVSQLQGNLTYWMCRDCGHIHKTDTFVTVFTPPRHQAPSRLPGTPSPLPGTPSPLPRTPSHLPSGPLTPPPHSNPRRGDLSRTPMRHPVPILHSLSPGDQIPMWAGSAFFDARVQVRLTLLSRHLKLGSNLATFVSQTTDGPRDAPCCACHHRPGIVHGGANACAILLLRIKDALESVLLRDVSAREMDEKMKRLVGNTTGFLAGLRMTESRVLVVGSTSHTKVHSCKSCWIYWALLRYASLDDAHTSIRNTMADRRIAPAGKTAGWGASQEMIEAVAWRRGVSLQEAQEIIRQYCCVPY